MGWYVEVLVRQVSFGGLQPGIFLDKEPFTSERIPVIHFESNPSSLGPWGLILVLSVTEGQNSPLGLLWLHDNVFFPVIPEKQFQI